MKIFESIQNKKPTYKLLTTLKINKLSVDNVLCEVYLPERSVGSIELIFFIPPDQLKLIGYPFKFSMRGEIRSFEEKTITIIRADEVYSVKQPTRYWGCDIKETILLGKPRDLTVIELLKVNSENDSKELSRGSFWLTPSKMLTPFKLEEFSYTGHVTVKTVREIKFTLANGVELNFDTHYKYKNIEHGETLVFSELVAEFETERKLEDIKSIVTFLDDYLLLVSFAERKPCICVGWMAQNFSNLISYYRRDITIPKNHYYNHRDTLIDIQYFDDFIKTVHDNYFKINQNRDLLTLSIYKAIDHSEGALEASFMTLFSAIENIVLFFRRNYQLEYSLPPEHWNNFKTYLKDYIKNYLKDKLKLEAQKRKFIYEKIEELNRIPFASVFKEFCSIYSINLEDLWPLTDTNKGISLTNIRNKIVHGESFNPIQFRALMAAHQHLKWILERLILSFLGWPIEKSNVSIDYLLRNMTMAKGWEEHRKILTA
ncbi:MAG: hypothetical protein PHU44_07165 [Syntrophales bacterium]|nr:hypothetical protein [Syntrophales bacterium]